MERLIGFGIAILIASNATEVRAQEKQKLSFKTTTAGGKYTQQTAIDVGDIPGHQVRIYELRFTYTAEAPTFEGVKATESWSRGLSDYTDGTGHANGYGVYILQNGEKIFSRFTLVTQTVVGPNGSKRSAYTSVGTLTGGTGRFRGIRGMLRTSGTTDFKTAPMQQTEGEYWIEK
jgi:hypothetical protein